MQIAEVLDVLARGQMRIHAGAMRQYAHAPARLERLLADADAIDEGIAADRACSTVYSMRKVVDLPAPFGPQQPGDAAIPGRARTHPAPP